MNNYFENEYLPKMHRIGTITNILGVVLSFAPAAVLAVVYGLLPDLNSLQEFPATFYHSRNGTDLPYRFCRPHPPEPPQPHHYDAGSPTS